MKKYKLIMTTTLEADNLDLIKGDVAKMNFAYDYKIDIDRLLNGNEMLVEETNIPSRETKTFLKIEEH